MKRHIIFVLLILASHFLLAQSKPYNVVFDLTSKDTLDHKAVIRWANEIFKTKSDAKLEVVLYGQALDMVVKDKSVVGDDLKELLVKKNLDVKVCAASMKRHNIDKSQLLPGVEVVPDGIYEIITKQGEGWGYIKVTH